MSKKDHKSSKMRSLFKGFRKSTTDLSEWNKNDEKLLKATEVGDLTKIDSLLSKKSILPTKLGPAGLSVFHIACSQGHLQAVDLLISHGAEVNTLTIQGHTSVQLAARDGWPQVVARLIEAGGVIDHKDSNGLTALHHACATAKIECVQILLQHGADPNCRDKSGKPPLFYSSYAGDLGTCKELLDKGASPNAHDEQQLTPLMASAKKGHVEICDLLLKRGAHADAADLQGHKALDYAEHSGFANMKELFDKAPTRASWDVQDTAPADGHTSDHSASGSEESEGIAADSQNSEMPEADQGDMVAKFVADATPEIQHRVITNDKTESTEALNDEETLAMRAAAPPQSVIENRTMEAYKELEEENEHMNEELRQLTVQNRRLQETVEDLQKKLAASPQGVQEEEMMEMEEEINQLKKVLEEEQERNQKLEKKLAKAIQHHQQRHQDEAEQDGNDSWNDSDEELFNTPARKSTSSLGSLRSEDKPQTFLLLQNQVLTLRHENKQLKERLQERGLSVSNDGSGDIEELNRKVGILEEEKERLTQQLRENVFENNATEKMDSLERENDELHTELDKIRKEYLTLKISTEKLKQLPNGDIQKEQIVHVNNTEDSQEIDSAISGKLNTHPDSEPANSASQDGLEQSQTEINALRAENAMLTTELESLRDTYNKLVIAGDNLQDMYDQLVLEKEQIHEEFEKNMQEKDELVKENEYLLSDGNNMHDDIEKLVQEVEKLQEKFLLAESQREELDRKLSAVNISSKASEMARLIEERDVLQVRVGELESVREQLEHDHEIVLEEVQSVQEKNNRLQDESDQLQQEFDSLQDELEQVQQQNEGLQQDYTQLEQDYSELLADKEKLEQEFLEVQTAIVNVEQQNPILQADHERLQQENGVLIMEKEQLDMTIQELSKCNALLEEELAKLKSELSKKQEIVSKEKEEPDKRIESPEIVENSNSDEIQQQKDKNYEAELKSIKDASTEKDRRIRSLQIQISRLQQQLAESDRHYRDVINTYRTHLLSAVQGHMDPDVRQALYNIIQLRSMEQFC